MSGSPLVWRPSLLRAVLPGDLFVGGPGKDVSSTHVAMGDVPGTNGAAPHAGTLVHEL